MARPFEIPADYNFARDDFGLLAIQRPDDRALLWVGVDGEVEDRSFAQMDLAGARAAALLAKSGLRRGDTVLILLSRELAWWELMLGCIRLGVIASPGTIQLKAKDVAYRCKASGARCIIASPEVADEVDAAWDGSTPRIIVGASRTGWANYADGLTEVDPYEGFADTGSDDDAFCYFSSGTTGQPKMAIHGHGYARAHRITGEYWLGLGQGDLHWNLSDNGWAKAAWSSLFGPWQQGASIFASHSRSFDPIASLDMLERFPITSLCAAPTAYRMFVRSELKDRNFSSLRHCVSAGEPLNPEVIELWSANTGLFIHDGYGQTETVLLCGNRPGATRSGSMGMPAPEFDMAVIDETGVPLPAGREGDIALRAGASRPPGLFKGYRGEAALNEAAFRNGWYLTGDRAIVDEDGFFWFVGRADDVILTAGYRIGPFEVESALFEHPSVAESAVVASPHEERGEVVKAFIVLAAGHEASADLVKTLQDHVKAITAPYKYPRRIEFVASLPKTISGKIRRKELRDREWARPALSQG